MIIVSWELIKRRKENKLLIQKFGTSYLISNSYTFERGKTVGVFFQNDNLVQYANEITVTLRNIEEKPFKDRVSPKEFPEGKFFCHFEHNRKYDLENNKIGLVLKIPEEAGFETDYQATFPIYWELEIKNEGCDFHHRFIIDIVETMNSNIND